MRKGIFLILFSCLLLACHQETWRERTVENLNIIKAHILTESPGPIDEVNPNFSSRMNAHYEDALKMAARVNTYGGYFAVLNYFVNSFHDSNIYFSDFAEPQPMYYAGFVLKYNGKKARVSSFGYLANKKNLPPVGAEFISCRGDNLTTIMKRNVFPFYGDARSESDWYYNVPMMFVSYQNPFITWPKHCTFKVNGQLKKYHVKLFEVSQHLIDHYYQWAAFDYQPKIGMSFPNAQTVWINWPTFNSVNNSVVWEMKKIIKKLPSLRARHTIVIDLRGNDADGANAWMDMLLSAIYGKNYFSWKMTQFPNVIHQYRVSEAAIRMLQSVTWRDQHAFGVHSIYFQKLVNTTEALKAAFERGDQLMPRVVKKFVAPANLVELQPQFSGHLTIITDGRCNGKCLDFIELAKHFPHVRVLGKVTAVNTLYTESYHPTFIDAGVGLHFGILKQVRRNRPSGQPFYPDVVYPKDINNTKALKAWVLEQQS